MDAAAITNIGDPYRKGVFKPRSYQLEMLEESMKRNIIVAMDTGSGKTHIAVMRIQAELERCSSGKLVWFCVPTVSLAIQQYEVIHNHLPSFQARVLSGADNVDLWTKQWIWDEMLKGIRIVVSTHQVLLDALVHGFIRMDGLALMVFDEAHSCTGNHPSSRILLEFYHDPMVQDKPVILGLTASPIVNGKIGGLEALETNLNAISRTPKLHRDELLRHIHPPELEKCIYFPRSLNDHHSIALDSLRNTYQALDIEEDPWIIKMRYCHDQIKVLYSKAVAIDNELGPSGADYYIHQCIQKLRRGVSENPLSLGILEYNEKMYMEEKLGNVLIPPQDVASPLDCPHLSPKVHALIDLLKAEDANDFSGLIFVRTRAEVAVLSHLLSAHTQSFQISTFVGSSAISGRKSTISELVDAKIQKTALNDLRYGKKNLIINTNALEEGIDVPRCKIVICFDKPPNLKSFIQRRGRARRLDSKYIIMFEDGSGTGIMKDWITLEAEMKEMYQDEMRWHEELREEEGSRNRTSLTVESTGYAPCHTIPPVARVQNPVVDPRWGIISDLGKSPSRAKLTLEDAVPHLYHFCATLPAAPYVDRSPIFFFEEYFSNQTTKSITAKVTLPNSVDVSIRHACGTGRWKTENMAKRDAAFECYRALYKAGLIDDNLLPLGHVDEGVDQAYSIIEKRPGLVRVSAQINPWPTIAQSWQQPTILQAFPIKIFEAGQLLTEMMIIFPCELPNISDFKLYWSTRAELDVVFDKYSSNFTSAVIAPAVRITSLLLRSIFRNKMDDRIDYSTLFVPCQNDSFVAWVESFEGTIPGGDLSVNAAGDNVGLIREITDNKVPYILRSILCASPEVVCDDGSVESTEKIDVKQNRSKDRLILGLVDANPNPYQATTSNDVKHGNHGHSNRMETRFEVTRLPKNHDFLRRQTNQSTLTNYDSNSKILLPQSCEIDRLPFKYSLFAMALPTIFHKIEIAMVTAHICHGILALLDFKDLSLVTTAITASSAREGTDYQRLEFYGDSMLKFLTSLSLMAGHLNYHEGILSHKKDHIVSNSSLASAALKKGLDKYILTRVFKGRKWQPLYNEVLLQDEHNTQEREISSKILADVVEALIGAADLDGGSEKALTCLTILLPHIRWLAPSDAHRILFAAYDVQIPALAHLAQVEELIAYPFKSRALLVEALTHSSHHGRNTSSYQRLEFLGDAVLDNIVTKKAFGHEPAIPTHKLHLIRTALVNANILGFFCLMLSISLPRMDIVADDSENISTVETSYPFHLWQAMRHASPTVCIAQGECLSRHQQLCTTISGFLSQGDQYPWTALARLEPPKFMSDMVESLLGAIYIDSRGSFPTCETFLDHLGLGSYLNRVVNEDIALLHPKEALGQLANQARVTYELDKEVVEGELRLTCRVVVGGEQIVNVGAGVSIMEVQTRAADHACTILKERGATPLNVTDGVDVRVARREGLEKWLGSESEEEGEEGNVADIDSEVYATAEE